MKEALDRIKRTVDALLEKYRLNDQADNKAIEAPKREIVPTETSVQPIAALVKSIVMEKRVQYAIQSDLQITTGCDDYALGYFASVNPDAFKSKLQLDYIR